jgi:hypothetical protein
MLREDLRLSIALAIQPHMTRRTWKFIGNSAAASKVFLGSRRAGGSTIGPQTHSHKHAHNSGKATYA